MRPQRRLPAFYKLTHGESASELVFISRGEALLTFASAAQAGMKANSQLRVVYDGWDERVLVDYNPCLSLFLL